MFTYQEVFANKNKVMFVMAHPDDAVVYYGALIYKLRQDHKEVFVVTVTDGSRGCGDKAISEEELGKLRLQEELSALKYLGVDPQNFVCLKYKDGEVESNYKLIGEITKYVRQFKAEVVCTHEPTAIYQPTYAKDGFFVQHRDHRKIAEAVVDSAYPFSRDRSFFPEHLEEGIEPHSFYEIVMTDEITSNFDLDYTDDLEIKKQALRLHQSQFDEGGINEIVDAVKFDGRYMERYFYVKLLW
jgi:LmbE family N-acetylglucosaminyl deacetylase